MGHVQDSKSAQISNDTRAAIAWLRSQPGVTNTIVGSYTAGRSDRPTGSMRVVRSTGRNGLLLRAYEGDGVREVYAYTRTETDRQHLMRCVTDRYDQTLRKPAKPATAKLAEAGIQRVRHEGQPRYPDTPSPIRIPDGIVGGAGGLVRARVTVDLAINWLERNTRNRPLRNDVVQRYATDMKAGHWRLSPDAIAFDTNLAVINGQHRLWAVIEAGVEQEFYVAFGLPPETVEVIDDHAKRRLHDVIRILRPGSIVTTLHTAIAAVLHETLMINTGQDARKLRLTRHDQMAFLDHHMAAVDFVVKGIHTKVRGITAAPVVAPIARAYYTQDQEALRRYITALRTGEIEEPTQNSVLILRNWLIATPAATRNRDSRIVIYRKAERALMAYLQGERLTRLMEAGKELFPLPEEAETATTAKAQ